MHNFHFAGEDEDSIEGGVSLEELGKFGLDGLDVFNIDLYDIETRELGLKGIETLETAPRSDDFLALRVEIVGESFPNAGGGSNDEDGVDVGCHIGISKRDLDIYK